MKTILTILFLLLLSITTSWSQLNKTVKELRADSITERVTGSGVKIKNSNIINPTINDSTIQEIVENYAPAAGASVQDSLRSFFALESKNGLNKIYGTPDSTNKLSSASIINDTILKFEDDALGEGSIITELGALHGALGAGMQLTLGSGLSFAIEQSYFYSDRVDLNTGWLELRTYPASVTDGAPTDAEIDGVVTGGAGRFIIVIDTDGTQSTYICVHNGTVWTYIELTDSL